MGSVFGSRSSMLQFEQYSLKKQHKFAIIANTMKPLNLSHPLIIMVVGLPGAGKSFFARQFSQTFGAPVISSDRLRHTLFAHPEFSPSEQTTIDDLREYMLREVAKTKRTFLVDGDCNIRLERQKLEATAKELGYNTLVVWVQTDEATAKYRSLHRSKTRDDDAHNQSLTAGQFDAFAKRLSPPSREQYVVISGKHTYTTQAKMVLRKLASPHQSEAGKKHQAKAQEAAKTRQLPPTDRKPPAMRRNLIIN